MRMLSKNPPLCTVYLCNHGGIHIVTHNVNVGMPLEKFHELNTEIQKASIQFETGAWPSPYIALTYNTTVICLNINDLPAFSDVMANAAELSRDVSEFDFIQAIDHTKCSVDQPHITALSAPQKEGSQNHILPLSPN